MLSIVSEKSWSELPVLKQPQKPKALKRDRSVGEETLKEHVKKAPRTMTPAESGSLRMGIRNAEPMSQEQMKLVKLFLNRTIASTTTHGEGPKFLCLSHKPGWQKRHIVA